MYYSVSDFYKQKFGSKVYKITIDAGCTCPNRDGTKAYGGCIFCSAAGSGDFIEDKTLLIKEQVQKAKQRIDSKFGSQKEKKYIVYFQNFTNTYGDEKLLLQKYEQALECEGVVGIAIGTRPDCISDFILDGIAKLCERTFVTIELGLQTAREDVGKYIRRFYSNDDYCNAVSRIHKADKRIHVVTHVIFGLPGETKKDMLNTVKFALENKTDGIKLSCLYVLKNTDLEKEYNNGKVKVLEMEEYFEIVKSALKLIPPDVVVHRLTGDGPKKILVAPEWTKNKKNVLNRLKEYLSTN